MFVKTYYQLYFRYIILMIHRKYNNLKICFSQMVYHYLLSVLKPLSRGKSLLVTKAKAKADKKSKETRVVAQDFSSGRGAISVHIKFYIGWGKGGHVDGSYMQSFECKRFHSE